MKVLFWIPYPVGRAPSQRFRFEQYVELLRIRGIEVTMAPFWDDAAWQILYSEGALFKKMAGLMRGITRRAVSLFAMHQYVFVFIHREAAPLGPPVFEWFIHFLGKRILYDFDDAIWINNTSAENRLVRHLKWHQKVSSICRWSYKVSAGNQYLCDYAKKYCSCVVLNPTTIDTAFARRISFVENRKKYVTIGWTGTHSTLQYLNQMYPVLEALHRKSDIPFRLLVIANKKPDFESQFMDFSFWKKESEILDLMRIDIGIMPLPDDEWTKGKCGFKALLYMALEIPTIVSPVGVNSKIIQHGVDGYLASDEREWLFYLEKLISDKHLRSEIGKKARQKIIANYSVESNDENFLSLWD